MKMKTYTSIFRLALAVITATTVYLEDPGIVASAQNTSTAHASSIQAPALPYGASEVVKLYQAGVHKDVIVSYINTTALPFHLSADGIIYLHTLGVPPEVTLAMIQRDGQLQQQPTQQQMAAAEAAANGAVAAQSPAQVVTPTTPAPSATVIGGSDYPYYYDYGYPYYYGYYGYGWPYYGGSLWVGGGRGWGHGGLRGAYGGFRGGFGGGHGGGGGHR
jgi:hypothetical protein